MVDIIGRGVAFFPVHLALGAGRVDPFEFVCESERIAGDVEFSGRAMFAGGAAGKEKKKERKKDESSMCGFGQRKIWI